MPKLSFAERVSPEMKLMLAASRPFMTEAEGQELRAQCTPEIKWQEFASLVDRHRLPGLTFYNLKRYANDKLPADSYQSFRQQAERNRQHELALSAEIVRLNRLFTANGIKAIFFKGPVLSLQVYGGLGLRHSRDIDVLAGSENIETVAWLLDANGYRPQGVDTAYLLRRRKAYTRFYQHFGFTHSQHGYYLELHWQLGDNPDYLTPEFEQGAMEHARNFALGGENLPALCEEDNFIYLCAHGAFHGWFRLKWLCDIAAFLRAPRMLDWEALSGEIYRLGLERPVAQAVVLANRLLGAPLPTPFREMGERVESLPKLIELAEQSMLKTEEEYYAKGKFNKIAFGFYCAGLRKEFKFKLKVLQKIWIDEQDWREFPLPAPLFFLYYFLRPVFWLLHSFGIDRRVGEKRT
jgi:Uncharacterised nucleotidyltransferase